MLVFVSVCVYNNILRITTCFIKNSTFQVVYLRQSCWSYVEPSSVLSLHKICITPLVVVCSLQVPKIIEFYLCIQMLPPKCKWLHFSWPTLYAPLHVISWPYLDIVSARSGGGHLLSLFRRCSTLCQMIYEILSQHNNIRTIDEDTPFLCPISTFSALGVFHVMRYKCTILTNLLTYLLTCSLIKILPGSCWFRMCIICGVDGKWAEFIDDKHAETQLNKYRKVLTVSNQIKSHLFVSVACIARLHSA